VEGPRRRREGSAVIRPMSTVARARRNRQVVFPTRPVDSRQVGGVVSTYPFLPARRGVLSRVISIGRARSEEREGVRQESPATAPAACRSSGGRACVIARPPLGSVAGRTVGRGPAQNRERLSARKLCCFRGLRRSAPTAGAVPGTWPGSRRRRTALPVRCAR